MKLFFREFWPIIVIIALWSVFSLPYFFKGLVPFPSDYLVSFFPPWNTEYGMAVKNNAMPDVITQLYPWKKLTIDIWKSGSVPLWNPYSFAGTPHAGNYQSAVFTPFNVLFFILPFLDAWSILILLQPLLAGLFMYIFVCSLGRSQLASLLSSIAFMFCGFIVVWMAYGTLGYAALFLPLILWGIQKKQGVVVSVAVAISLLAGHMQTSVYVILAALCYSLWQKRTQGIVYIVIGLLLAAPQVALGFESFIESGRDEAILKGEVIPWGYLITFIAPDFFGNPVTRNDWFGHYAEWAGFIGVIPFVFALNSLERRSRQSLFFIILGIGSLLLALPTIFNSLLYVLKIPVLSGSAASRIIYLSSFSFAVLSSYGVDNFLDSKKKRLIIPVICIVLLLLIWALLLFGSPFPPDKLDIAKRNFVLPSVFIAGMSVAFLIRKKFILYILIGFVAIDMLRFAIKWMPFSPKEFIYPEFKSLSFLRSRVKEDRVFGNIGAGEVGVMYRIPLVEGYDAVYPARYGEFIQAISKGYILPGMRSVVQFDKYGLYKTEAMKLLGIRYIYHRFSDARNVWAFPYWDYLDTGSMKHVYSDEKYEIFEYSDAYSRTFLASSYEVIPDKNEIINKLFSTDFDRRNMLILEEKPTIEPVPGPGSATIVSYASNNVVIRTEATTPKLLFLSDTFDTGWQAKLDGKDVPVYRADFDFRAVSVPDGVHTVEFIYAPKAFTWGIILSGIGVVALFFLHKRV